MTSLEPNFKHPSTILLSGPINWAKTRFVRRILDKRLIDPFPTQLIWVYSKWHKDYDKVRTCCTCAVARDDVASGACATYKFSCDVAMCSSP